MKISGFSLVAGALFGALAWSTRAADPPQAPRLAAQLQACISCHGPTGESVAGDIPNLAGQKRDYLAVQLAAFRSGERKHDMMQAIAKQLSPEDIKGLADHWSKVPVARATPQGGIPSRMQFPAGFPAGLTEYDRDVDPATRIVFVRYANAPAWAAARAKRPLPAGSMLMTGEYAAQLDAAGQPLKDPQGRWVAGDLQTVTGMQSQAGWGDAMPALLRNADWNYGLWSAAGVSRIGNDHARCLACHKPLDQQSHVFTLPALQRAAAGHLGR
jgi:cytochrome c553